MVSIIIPLYNSVAYVGRCLDSILHQSYGDIEVIVVDDCGTDGSVAVVERYCEQHPCIRMVHHDRNRGVMMARCSGHMAASADFIMFADSDDVLPCDAVEKLMERQRQTDADIVMGDLQKLYVNGRIERRVASMGHTAEPVEVLRELFYERISHSLCGKLFRKDLFSGDLHKFDHLSVAEDACLLYQLMTRAKKVASVKAMVYSYYENEASTSHGVYDARDIEGVILTFKTIKEVCWQYTQLHDCIQRRLTRVAFTMYLEPTSASAYRQLLRKHGLQEYVSIRSALKYLTFKDYWFLAKRFALLKIKKGKH